MSIGPAEIVIVLVLALLVFGPKRLPQMGKSLGKGVREFRKAAETAKTELGLGEVTDQINEVKADVHRAPQGRDRHLQRPQVERRPQERPSRAPGAASRRGRGAVAGALASATPAAESPSPAAGAFDEGPETPAVTPQTVFADVPRSPAAAARSPPPAATAARTRRGAGRPRVAGRPRGRRLAGGPRDRSLTAWRSPPKNA